MDEGVDKDIFQIVLNFYFECGGSYDKLANEFKVSGSTIDRWKNNKNLPVAKVREVMIKRILDFKMEDIAESKGIIN